MSMTYYTFYKRLIESKQETKESITAKVQKAYSKGKLTEAEYNDLINLINQIYNEVPDNNEGE